MDTKHYLRLLRTLALAALTAAATAACSDDTDPDREPITPDDANPGIPVTFTANINPGSDAAPAAAPGTRTILTPTTEGGFTVTWKGKDNYAGACDWICIWAAKDNTLTSQSSKYYVPTTSGVSSALEPENDTQKLTLTEPGDWTFRAVYGESSSGNGRAAANVSPQSQSAPNDTEHIARRDFSIATTTQTVEANTAMPQSINLGFKHMLSALQLHVTNQSGEALTVKEIRLSAAGGQITYRKTYDVAAGGWKADEEKTSDYLQLTIDAPAALATGGTESQNFHMLFFPGYANTDMIITVITDRGEYTLTKPAPTGGFLAGTNYMVDDIVIKTDGLQSNETWRETIRNAEELKAFRNRVNRGNSYSGKTVYLLDNIDLSGETWTPIGTDDLKPFQGTFDGGGYHISKLSVDNGSNGYAGLFGYVYKGTVRNLRVSGTVTTTGYNAGGIAGNLSSNSTVENCIFDGDVSGKSVVGGIAGQNSANSRIAGCHTNGSITATSSYTGGIAGINDNIIDGCYSSATVSSATSFGVGGISGTNDGNSSSIVTHCYATGTISALLYVGGIIGINNAPVGQCIALNASLKRTSGSNSQFGRIVGMDNGDITSCAAYDGMTITDANGSFTVTGNHGDALTREQCLSAATYTSRGFTEANGWAFDSGATWQYLPWNKAFESFDGIQPADYRISVPAHLKAPVIN